MNFSDLMVKNFKGNARKYISVFMCCVLCIIVLQVFLSILNNQTLSTVLVSKNIRMLLNFSLVVLVIFMIFFISYGVQTFLKLRSKEFGLYLIIGILRKELTQMILFETCIITLLALAAGLSVGTLFSYILFILFRSILGLENIAFTVNIISYIQATGVFLLIFIIQLILVWLYSKRLQLTELIKYWKRPENIRMPGITASLILCAFALFLMFFSFLKLHNYISASKSNGVDPATPITFVVSCFLGTYILISRVGYIFIYLCKKLKKNYYNNLLSITEIGNKIKQYKKVIFSATILGIILIFFVSAAYSIMTDVPRVTEIEQPFHLAYVDFNDNYDPEIVNELLNKSKDKPTSHNTTDFLFGNRIIHFGKFEDSRELTVISDVDYNSITGRNINLVRGEALQINSDLGGKKNDQFPFDSIKLEFGKKSYDFHFSGEERTFVINLGVQPSRFMIIIDKADFQTIKNDVEAHYSGTFNLLNFDNWKSIGPMASELKKVFDPANPFKTVSRIEYYNSVRQESSMRLFIVAFMGILFLICMSCVIYFKMITDIEQLKNKYRKLFGIGITNSEFKKVLSSELKIIFFTPVLSGAILGYVLIRIVTFNSRMEDTFSINTFMVMVTLFLFQSFYYLITRRKYYKDIVNH